MTSVADAHAHAPDETAAALDGDERRGLSDEEAARRPAQHGSERLDRVEARA